MRRPRFFELNEFLTSSTARQKSIENLPSWTIVEHLNELALWMDELRDAWGSGIHITSGFRNQKLNSAVGGVPASVHQIGFACDCVPSNGRYKEFVAFLKQWAKDKQFDQIIEETSKKSKWVHIGLYNNRGEQRRQVFNMNV